ncbi:hypothetical protein [Thorsellia anophelis]|uniref:PH domain-containing protein n=1 Tax=Thorsellia anophelis DSM 18579 TaxID=1123402 RepID=A0A1I0EIG8_9GAMM|nr:hypothetical protein [Thorsellia anophelis]SET44237.1 hypothetical protein SAMN02583745_02376 [Thorsellia anophelis DSM 18579]
MNNSLSPQESYQLEALQMRAKQPTAKIDFIPDHGAYSLLYLAVIFSGMTGLFIFAYPLDTYSMITNTLILIGLLSITIVLAFFAYQGIFNKTKPIMTLSEEGIFVRNMKRALPLEYIGDINLTVITIKGNELWRFDFQLLPGWPDLGLKFSPFIESKYKRGKRFYSLKTAELKGYTIESVRELVIEYREIVIARQALSKR